VTATLHPYTTNANTLRSVEQAYREAATSRSDRQIVVTPGFGDFYADNNLGKYRIRGEWPYRPYLSEHTDDSDQSDTAEQTQTRELTRSESGQDDTPSTLSAQMDTPSARTRGRTLVARKAPAGPAHAPKRSKHADFLAESAQASSDSDVDLIEVVTSTTRPKPTAATSRTRADSPAITALVLEDDGRVVHETMPPSPEPQRATRLTRQAAQATKTVPPAARSTKTSQTATPAALQLGHSSVDVDGQPVHGAAAGLRQIRVSDSFVPPFTVDVDPICGMSIARCPLVTRDFVNDVLAIRTPTEPFSTTTRCLRPGCDTKLTDQACHCDFTTTWYSTFTPECRTRGITTICYLCGATGHSHVHCPFVHGQIATAKRTEQAVHTWNDSVAPAIHSIAQDPTA
jgi:hypothetical protein